MPNAVTIAVELSAGLIDPEEALRSLLEPTCLSRYAIWGSIDSPAPELARFVTVEIAAADLDRVMARLGNSGIVVDALPEPDGSRL
jgi:hypothetical protein